MPIRFVDTARMLRLTDPRSRARLCEAQQLELLRLSIKRIGMFQTFVRWPPLFFEFERGSGRLSFSWIEPVITLGD